MDADRSWEIIEQQRLAIADLLGKLSAEQWEAPSLCAGWRVRDVAAHLSLGELPPTPGELLWQGVKAGGSFHRLNTAMSVRRAARPTAQLVADLREHAGSRKVPSVSSHRNVLYDVLVHGQDIAVPLGLDLPMPADAAGEGASRVWTMGWPFWAKHRLRGLRLTATDLDWTVGSGADVSGPIRAILLLLTGRTSTAATDLAGPGTTRLPGVSSRPPRSRS
ncbi:MAG TPA: maleylpyruvate isomerase family mycothiol-dependent enzyme [Mycobacteriales bacterium]